MGKFQRRAGTRLLQSIGYRKDEDMIIRRGLADLAVASENNQAVEGRTVESGVEPSQGRFAGYRQGRPGRSSSQAVGIGQNPRVIEKADTSNGINPPVHNHPVMSRIVDRALTSSSGGRGA